MAQRKARYIAGDAESELRRIHQLENGSPMQIHQGDTTHNLWTIHMPLLDRDGAVTLMALIEKHVQACKRGALKRLYKNAQELQVQAMAATVTEGLDAFKAQDEDGTADYEGD